MDLLQLGFSHASDEAMQSALIIGNTRCPEEFLEVWVSIERSQRFSEIRLPKKGVPDEKPKLEEVIERRAAPGGSGGLEERRESI